MDFAALRIPEDLKKKLETIAKEEHRSLSNLIRLILIQWLEEKEKSQKKPSK